MTDTAAFLRLMSWLSPVFPTGGYAYSSGLEQAVRDGAVSGPEDLEAWTGALLSHGPQWNDAVLFAAGWRASGDRDAITGLAELARALANTFERHRETTDQGAAFLEAASNWFEDGVLPPRGTPLCVAVGAACGLMRIPITEAVAAYLHAFVTNQLQAAIRLSVTGQRGAARLLANLEPLIAETAHHAARSDLESLGSCAILADIAAMKHETLEPRLFLS